MSRGNKDYLLCTYNVPSRTEILIANYPDPTTTINYISFLSI